MSRVIREIPAHVVYKNLATQTDFAPAVSRQPTAQSGHPEEQHGYERAPLPSIRSKTIPVGANKFSEDFVLPQEEPLGPAQPQISSRPSKVMWKGVEEGTQTTGPDPQPGSEVCFGGSLCHLLWTVARQREFSFSWSRSLLDWADANFQCLVG